MIIFITIAFLLILSIVIVFAALMIKTNAQTRQKTIECIQDILDLNDFSAKKTIIVNKHLVIAVNKNYTKIAVIEDFNPKNPDNYRYFEVISSMITSIEKAGSTAKINYRKQGDEYVLIIHPLNNELKECIHKLFQEATLKKIQYKFPDYNFSIYSASDWNCSYVWAYSPQKAQFAYYKTENRPACYKINLRHEHFTLDTKYKYFEAPILGKAQQLFIYDNNFLYELFSSILQTIKQKTVTISEGLIYFDNYSEIIYLSNGSTSLQSIIADKVEEVNYKDNRMTFTLKDDEKSINFFASQEFMLEFEDFLINYNLRKIANNFDYQTDRLINTTDNTKFIIDTTRDRVVYCAGLNTFSKFNFLTISFDNLESAQVIKTSSSNFVRIKTKDNETIDVTCKKNEVAHYIMAQLQILMNGQESF